LTRKTYNAAQLARELGVDRGTVSKWVSDGCPAERLAGKTRGVAWAFELPLVLVWLLDRAREGALAGHDRSTLAQIERRKAQVELELAELRLAELRGEVLRVDDVLEIVGADYDSLRRVLASIPARVGPELWAKFATGATELQTVEALEQVVDEVQRSLSGDQELGGGNRKRKPEADPVVAGGPEKPTKRNRAKSPRKATAAAAAKPKSMGRPKPTAKRRSKR
jgi:phage terminase Nu1 subunit (DNA packaging protein)